MRSTEASKEARHSRSIAAICSACFLRTSSYRALSSGRIRATIASSRSLNTFRRRSSRSRPPCEAVSDQILSSCSCCSGLRFNSEVSQPPWRPDLFGCGVLSPSGTDTHDQTGRKGDHETDNNDCSWSSQITIVFPKTGHPPSIAP